MTLFQIGFLVPLSFINNQLFCLFEVHLLNVGCRFLQARKITDPAKFLIVNRLTYLRRTSTKAQLCPVTPKLRLPFHLPLCWFC